MIITPKSLTITQILSAESEQYVVPAYQRRYSWQEKQFWELLDDVSLLEGADTHLLGSIVCLTGYYKAGINALFADALNIGDSNNPHERKKSAYLSSAIKLTNSLPTELPEFPFEQDEERSADFAELAIKLWPVP